MEPLCDSKKGFEVLAGQARPDLGVGIFSFACYEKRVLDACSEVRAELLRACLKPLWSSARLEAAVAEGASEERCVVM